MTPNEGTTHMVPERLCGYEYVQGEPQYDTTVICQEVKYSHPDAVPHPHHPFQPRQPETACEHDWQSVSSRGLTCVKCGTWEEPGFPVGTRHPAAPVEQPERTAIPSHEKMRCPSCNQIDEIVEHDVNDGPDGFMWIKCRCGDDGVVKLAPEQPEAGAEACENPETCAHAKCTMERMPVINDPAVSEAMADLAAPAETGERVVLTVGADVTDYEGALDVGQIFRVTKLEHGRTYGDDAISTATLVSHAPATTTGDEGATTCPDCIKLHDQYKDYSWGELVHIHHAAVEVDDELEDRAAAQATRITGLSTAYAGMCYLVMEYSAKASRLEAEIVETQEWAKRKQLRRPDSQYALGLRAAADRLAAALAGGDGA